MQGGRFDPKPSQDGEKDKKRRKKVNKKIVVGAGFESTTLRLQILHLPARLKLQSAITPVKFYGFFSKVFSGDLLIISYQLTKFQASSLNTFYPADNIFFKIFQRAITPKGEITRKRKKIRVSYFIMMNPHMKFQDSSFNGLKDTIGTKSVTHSRTHPLTDAPKAICPINFFKVGGINML